MTDLTRYPRTIFWSEEDDGFIALVADLPGCSAFGETQENALAELEGAMTAWIAAARFAGNPIPPPSAPPRPQSYSGKVLVRMPKSLHQALAATAEREGVSLNVQIVTDLKGAMAARDAGSAAGTTKRTHTQVFDVLATTRK